MPMYKNLATRTYSSDWIAKYGANVQSQSLQDGLIAHALDVIGIQNKHVIEFGAWDGVYLSNSWNLINNHGFSATLIEGNPHSFPMLVETYKDVDRVACVNAYVAREGDDSLDNILRRSGAPIDPDLLIIDIDGNDYHVWDGLKEFYPRVVMIEYNNTIPLDVFFVQDYDGKVSQGASLRALVELGREKGYELVCADSDAIFVQKDLFPLFNMDNDIFKLAEAHQTKIWQGYDGTLFIAGKRNLTWADTPTNIDDEPRQLVWLGE
jgi:hypothetical protein